MPDASIRATLGLDTKEWKSNITSASQDVTKLTAAVNESRATVAALERAMRSTGGGTAEQVKQFQDAQQAARQYTSDLRRAEAQVKAFNAVRPQSTMVTRTPDQVNRRAGGSAAGEGIGRSGTQEIEHSARAFGDALMAGQSPLQAIGQQADRLTQAFGGGLGVMAFVTGLSLGVETIHRAMEETEGLRKAVREATVPLGGGGAAFTSMEALESHVGELRKSLHAALDDEGTVMHALGNMGEDALTYFHKGTKMTKEDLATSRDAAAITGAQREVSNTVGGMVEKEQTRNKVGQDTNRFGADSSTDERIDQRTDERIGDIRRSPELQTHGPELVADAKAQGQTAKEAAHIAQADRAAAIALEERIVDIKRDGLDVDIKSAKARLEAAEKALERRPELQGNDRTALEEAISAGKVQVEAAEKATREKVNQVELETRIAQLRGSSDQVRQKTLDAERANIEQRMASTDTKPEEIPGLGRDQARNQQQQDEFAKQKRQHAIDIQEAEDRAHAGRGDDGRIAALNKEQARNNDRRELNQSENGNDAGVNAQLDEKATALTRAIEDVTFAENSRLTALQNQETQIKKKGYQPTPGDKEEDIRQKYDKQKADATHAGNLRDLPGIEANRQAELDSVATDEEEMTPAQKLARARHNDQRDRADYRRKNKVDNRSAAQKTSDDSFTAAFHPAPANVPSLPPADVAPEPATPGGSDVDSMTAFQNQPNPFAGGVPTLPPMPMPYPNLPDDGGGMSDKNIVTAIHECTAAVKSISFKNKP